LIEQCDHLGWEQLETLCKDTDALNWIRQAADRGDVQAQTCLGLACSNGWGVAEDDQVAVTWFRKAAEKGLAQAECYLGARYRDGEGVSKNYDVAKMWLEKAAGQGNYHACFELFWWSGLTLSDQMSEKEMIAHFHKGGNWLREGAQRGCGHSQFMLGLVHTGGTMSSQADELNASGIIFFAKLMGVRRDYGEAFKWFSKVAKKNFPDAQYYLGMMYLEGMGLSRDFNKAAKWLYTAAKGGSKDAKKKLQELGIDVPK